MRVLVDENIPLKTVVALRGAGHDVLDVRGTPEEGIDDPTLWRIAQRQKRLLVTTDKGFAQHRHESHHGVVIVRLRQPNRDRIDQRVIDAIALVRENDWDCLLVTMRDRLHSLWRPQTES